METSLPPTIQVAREKHTKSNATAAALSQNSCLPVTGRLCAETGNMGVRDTPVATQVCERQRGDTATPLPEGQPGHRHAGAEGPSSPSPRASPALSLSQRSMDTTKTQGHSATPHPGQLWGPPVAASPRVRQRRFRTLLGCLRLRSWVWGLIQRRFPMSRSPRQEGPHRSANLSLTRRLLPVPPGTHSGGEGGTAPTCPCPVNHLSTHWT